METEGDSGSRKSTTPAVLVVIVLVLSLATWLVFLSSFLTLDSYGHTHRRWSLVAVRFHGELVVAKPAQEKEAGVIR